MTSQHMARSEQMKYSAFRQQPLFMYKWLINNNKKEKAKIIHII